MNSLHPRAVVLFFISFIGRSLSIIIFLTFMLIAGISNNEPELSGLTNTWPLALIALIIIVLAFSAVWAKLSYNFYKYELSTSGFKKEEGVIWKKYVTIPYDRIQNVDIYRGPVARLLGLSDLQIQTAGYSFNNKNTRNSEGRLFGIEKTEAEHIRNELVNRITKA